MKKKIEIFENGKKIDEARVLTFGKDTIFVGEADQVIMQMPKKAITEKEKDELKREIQKFSSGQARFLFVPYGWKLLAIRGKKDEEQNLEDQG